MFAGTFLKTKELQKKYQTNLTQLTEQLTEQKIAAFIAEAKIQEAQTKFEQFLNQFYGHSFPDSEFLVINYITEMKELFHLNLSS
jgi:restriction endonuclease S subunit